MLENIQRGDICVFQNGEEATIVKLKRGECGPSTVRLYFNKEVEGLEITDKAWNYDISGKWLGTGNNIVKVIKHV